MEEKKNLADFAKDIQNENGIIPAAEKSGAHLIPTVVANEKPVVSVEAVDNSEVTKKPEYNPNMPLDLSTINTEELIRSMQMQSNRHIEEAPRGIVPNFTEEEVSDIKNSVDKAADFYIAATEKDYAEAIKLLAKYGYSEADIDRLSWMQAIRIAAALREDIAEGTVGDLANVSKDSKIVDLSKKVSGAVASVQMEGQDEEGVSTQVNNNNEDDDYKEDTLKDLLNKDEKKVYIKYSDKPLNSYTRGKDKKSRLLLNRQKRGNYVEGYLPNSNVTLRVYEMHQPAVMSEIVNLTSASQDIMIKERVIEAILERSQVIAADGHDITVEGLKETLSQDDIPFIFTLAAAANKVGKVPYGVTCARCNTEGTIQLDIEYLFAKSQQDIPDEMKLNFLHTDTYERCIEKSLANKTMEVYDKDARCKIYLNNPSIKNHVKMGSAIKSHIVTEFADKLPEALRYQTVDTKFDFLLSLNLQEIGSMIGGCLLLSYITRIDLYKFDDIEGKEWFNDSNLEETFSIDEDSIESLIEVMASLEQSTLDIVRRTIDAEFIRRRCEISSGPWICPKPTCKATNETRVEGLELFILSLLQKMEDNK